ncbi:hypothetical protein RchiOBHm_Chr0c11g0499351 [Rosa chinensis]|uniref:Uncharacterized protein n=1 Tax=Rosa chinensis TaxID=74649 RepID=A0A2P6SQQ9_ROSCH|nr:hypothetical protein RchiOBHm_Chr0c11g0499351 [Rosa chinensis]
MEGVVIWPRRITKKGLSKQTLTMYKHGFSNPVDISLLVFIYALEGMSFNGTHLRQQRSSKLLKNVSISCYAMFPNLDELLFIGQSEVPIFGLKDSFI